MTGIPAVKGSKGEQIKVRKRNEEKVGSAGDVEGARRKQIPPCPILCRIHYSGTESLNADN